MSTDIIDTGLKELIERMKAFPDKLKEGTKATMDAALLVLWQNVPPYPPYPDPLGKGSSYTRTGTLGRSLGSSEGGGQDGTPDIYEAREMGGMYEGHFGTNLDYAPYVIGDEEQSKRLGYWWTMKDIAEKAKDRIVSIFGMLAATMKKWLEGQGL